MSSLWERGFSVDFNKGGISVEYIEAERLSLSIRKSSYNLPATEELIWAPSFGLLGLLWFGTCIVDEWNNLSYSSLTFRSKNSKEQAKPCSALNPLLIGIALSCNREMMINVCSYSTLGCSKGHFFTPITTSFWGH